MITQTSYRPAYWLVPIVASAFFGAGIYIVILAILNYAVDIYGVYRASALAAVILVRDLVGGGFSLFAAQLCRRIVHHSLRATRWLRNVAADHSVSRIDAAQSASLLQQLEAITRLVPLIALVTSKSKFADAHYHFANCQKGVAHISHALMIVTRCSQTCFERSLWRAACCLKIGSVDESGFALAASPGS